MRVLIAPMAAIAETSGPFSRAKALAIALQRNRDIPAFCAAMDVNYQPIEGVQEYFAPLPSPMGLPMALGKRMFGMAQRLGLQQRRKVHSFEEVLFIVGALKESFLAEDVSAIRKAVRNFKPDLVYAEFRPAAIVAAKLENIPVATGYSYPARKAYASSPQYSKGVKRYLKQQGLCEIESVLDIFEWADLKVVPSCYELEPLDDPKVIFTGPFQTFTPQLQTDHASRNAIVVYLGSGSISYARQLSVLKQAFSNEPYQVYIASYQAETADMGNIHVARRFDFNSLLPSAVAFINHGGQNSLLSGVMAGVPQIIFPGNVFERQYNADSIEWLKIGYRYEDAQFNPATLMQAVQTLQEKRGFSENIPRLQNKLAQLGGVDRAFRGLSGICSSRGTS
jgi:UDP:flavonoid glycosyltransferase YjiC (YdhE family)